MAIYFKFKSEKNYDAIPVEANFVTVSSIRTRISEKISMGRKCSFHLVIYDAQTNEEYSDEEFLVPRNSSVIVRRTPANLYLQITTEDNEKHKSAESTPLVISLVESKLKTATTLECVLPEPANCLDQLEVSSVQEYEIPHPVISKEEDNKIKNFVFSSTCEWQRQIKEGYHKGFRNYGTEKSSNGKPLGYKISKAVPHSGYICRRCGITGHYIQHCPTNGDPTYDLKKLKAPKGIPRTMLAANSNGLYQLPNGEMAAFLPNNDEFDKEMLGLPSKRRAVCVPSEFLCPLCLKVMKQAMISSKCCFKSYCDPCIREQIISKARCACGATNILADHLLPNVTLREAIDRLIEPSPTSSSSMWSVGRTTNSQASTESTITSLHVQDAKVPQSLNTTGEQRNVKDQICAKILMGR